MDDDRPIGEMMDDVQQHGRAAAKGMAELMRAVLLSGVGAAALAMDEAKALVDKLPDVAKPDKVRQAMMDEAQTLLDRLVERGQLAEEEARVMLEDLSRRSRLRMKRQEAAVERQVTESMGRLGVPSKSDLAELDSKVGLLTEKIDRLLADWTESRPTPPQV